MTNRHLQPREESYRWAIEKLDDAFGQERVTVTPKNHYHVIRVVIAMPTGHSEELILRDPTQDLNRREKREEYLTSWIARMRKTLAATRRPPVLVKALAMSATA